VDGTRKSGSLVVVAAAARGDEVVKAVIAAGAPRDEMVDLSLAADTSATVEAHPGLEIEEISGYARQRGAVAPEEELFELEDRAGRLDLGVELGCLVRPPAGDERAKQGA
jgi:hypothetical protein